MYIHGTMNPYVNWPPDGARNRRCNYADIIKWWQEYTFTLGSGYYYHIGI